MGDEVKKLNEIILDNDESVPEKFRGKSAADLLASYKEAEDLAHSKAEALKAKERELEDLRSIPDPDPEIAPDPDLTYDSLYGDDEYVQKDVMEKRLAAMEKKNEEALKSVEDRAVATAMARIERNTFIDNHPEIFHGKKPEEADAVIKRIAGAGFIAGQQSLEGGLQAIREMAGEIGVSQPATNDNRDVPSDLQVVGQFDSPKDEVSHMVEYHKKNKGKLSDTLR